MSKRTADAVEMGESVSDATLYKIERALDWVPGSARQVLEGGDPTLAAEAQAVTTATEDVGLAILRATPEELVRMRRYLEETTKSRDEADQWLLDALRMRDEAEQRARRGRDVG